MRRRAAIDRRAGARRRGRRCSVTFARHDRRRGPPSSTRCRHRCSLAPRHRPTPLSALRDGIVWELRAAAGAHRGRGRRGPRARAAPSYRPSPATRSPTPTCWGSRRAPRSVRSRVVLLGARASLLPLAAFAGRPRRPRRDARCWPSAARRASPRRARCWRGSRSRRSRARSRASSSSGRPPDDSYREILGWLLGSLAAAPLGGGRDRGRSRCSCSASRSPFARTGAWMRSRSATPPQRRSASRSGATRWGLLGSDRAAHGRPRLGQRLDRLRRARAPARGAAAGRSGAPRAAAADRVGRRDLPDLGRHHSRAPLFDPRELPVGIVTAIIGAPVFALILARKRGVA